MIDQFCNLEISNAILSSKQIQIELQLVALIKGIFHLVKAAKINTNVKVNADLNQNVSSSNNNLLNI